jgi:hypothetical protein
MSKHPLLWFLVGAAGGYFMASTLVAYPPWSLVTGLGSGS